MTTTIRALSRLLAPLLLLGACSTPYHPPVVVRDSMRFPGVAAIAAASGARPVDLILVHGMCTTYVSKDAPPFLIVHGDKDDQVSIKQSQAFSEALKAAGVDVNFITIKDATHSKGWENFNEDKIVGDFLEKYLKK